MRAEDYIPQVFPRMGSPEGYPSDYPPVRAPPFAPDYERGPPPGGYADDYGRRPPPGYPGGDYDRPLPYEYEMVQTDFGGYERRPILPGYQRERPLGGYPPAEHGRWHDPHQRHGPPVHLRDGGRYDAGAGHPPRSYEPEVRFNRPESPRRPQPPIVAYPPEQVKSPPRPSGGGDGGGQFPPMPYEPAVAAADPPPPPMKQDRAPEGEPQFPPMPYEPVHRSPHHHHEGPPPQRSPRMNPRDDDVAVPYHAQMGIPPDQPFQQAHYGHATEHGHIKRKHLQGCKDYWAAFIFFFHFWAVVGVCIYLGVRGVIKTNENEDLTRHSIFAPSPPVSDRLYSIKHWAPQLAAAAGSGWLFAMVWQHVVRSATMIKACLALGAVATGLLGIILISTGTTIGIVGLIFLVSALFQGLYVHLVRERIPFAACMYKKTRDVLRHYKGLYIISAWHVLLALAWLALWIFGVSGAVSLPHGGWYAALLVLSLAWSIEVLRNIVYVTVAGLVGTYYYEARHMPHVPTLRALQRAWTISFGSICLGSLFVAPVQTLHCLAKRLANEQGENEFMFSCVNCFLGVLNFFMRHFNKWAFVNVGLHGNSFVKSARRTWDMFENQGAMLLINDDLTGAILLSSCLIGGVLTALVGGCWTFATHSHLTVGVSIISFFIGFFVTYLTMVVRESAVAAYYVCFAEDPATLKKIDEAHYQYMVERKRQLDQQIA